MRANCDSPSPILASALGAERIARSASSLKTQGVTCKPDEDHPATHGHANVEWKKYCEWLTHSPATFGLGAVAALTLSKHGLGAGPWGNAGCDTYEK